MVSLRLPAVLAELAGGRTLELPAPADGTLGGLLDTLSREHPMVERRLRDETGTLRRYVNVYVDGLDVRPAGPAAGVPDGSVVEVIPSVAGG